VTEALETAMYLTRSQDQKGKTLDEFYAEIARSDNPIDRDSGTAMLDLLARLRELPDERRVYGLTSHYRLCLLAADRSPWFVIVSALDKGNYFIEYRMAESAALGPHASVKGKAHSESEAVRMILMAMEKSEGWPNNSNA